MKILIIGGPGTVGTGIVSLLEKEHEVISVGKTRGVYQVDLEDRDSVEKMFADHPDIDGIISTVGSGNLVPLVELSERDIDLAINSKLKASVNLIQLGIKYMRPNGFITLTSGTAGHQPISGAASMSMACAGLEGLVKATAVEDTRDIRINAVSPFYIKETLEEMGVDSSIGIPAIETAKVYKMLLESNDKGVVVDVKDYVSKN